MKGLVACCQKMFVYWLQGKGREATWEVLIELLDDIDQAELTKYEAATVNNLSTTFIFLAPLVTPKD